MEAGGATAALFAGNREFTTGPQGHMLVGGADKADHLDQLEGLALGTAIGEDIGGGGEAVGAGFAPVAAGVGLQGVFHRIPSATGQAYGGQEGEDQEEGQL